MGTVHARPELWDAFLQAGGNCFDTARHYGDESEGELGRFLERHAARDSVVVVGKARAPTRLPSGRRAARARPEPRAAANGPRRPPAAPPGRPGRTRGRVRRRPGRRGRRRPGARGRPLELGSGALRGLQRVRAAPRSRTGGRALEPALARGDARAHVERVPARRPGLARAHGNASARLVGPGARVLHRPARRRRVVPLVALGGEPRTSPARRGARQTGSARRP